MLIDADTLKFSWQKKRWPNFGPHEFSCPCCGEAWWEPAQFDMAQRLRTLLARPVRFNSTHRCQIHNARVGGAPMSQHKKIAFDFNLLSPQATAQEIASLQKMMVSVGFRTFGLYRTFVHIDARVGRYWVTPAGKQWAEVFKHVA